MESLRNPKAPQGIFLAIPLLYQLFLHMLKHEKYSFEIVLSTTPCPKSGGVDTSSGLTPLHGPWKH